MEQQLKFAVVGGDMRSANLAGLLASDGHSVRAYALEKYNFAENVTKAFDFAELMKRVDCVILPLPIQSDPDVLNAPLSLNSYSVNEIFNLFHIGQTVIAGKVGNSLFERAGHNGILLFDYLEREEFTVANSVACAEGAIQLAMEELPITLHNANCLVIGFGHIGKLLSHYLAGLGANVTASARKYGDLAWIRAYGYNPANTGSLSGMLGSFDVIFNTVPSRILTAELLEEVRENCLVIDLASKPGGIDFNAAKRLGVKVIWALSLPGKVAPVTAGIAMRDTIYNILSEWGVGK
ncbi:MAG: dipicolinate synthase subunit DpsA [Clostridiales bacterium]|jgi:dipicolinate synthase subunit A|nr:dipicolinate synthase subunit DpsA [Clostridiales bacterium]